MIDSLILNAGVDIPFGDKGLMIHCPTLKEIAMLMGYQKFMIANQILDISKDSFGDLDKNVLDSISNFEIFMTLIMDKTSNFKEQRDYIKQLFFLLFPNYELLIEKNRLVLTNDENEVDSITKENFEEFKDIVLTMFCFKENSGKSEYNPAGDKAKELIKKFQQRKEILSKKNRNEDETNIFSRYISILAVGEQKDINVLYNYSIFQLLDEYQRYMLKYSSDLVIKYKLAGAQDVKDPEDWMKDVHIKSNNDNELLN